MRPRLGRAALWLLARGLPREEVDAVAGDLLETAEAEGRGRTWLTLQAAAVALGFLAARAVRYVGEGAAITTVRDILNGEGGMMEGWRKDFAVAARSLARRPGFTAIVVGTLALGVGANTAIFSMVRGSVLFDLPYHEPGRVMWHSDGWSRSMGGWGSSQSLPNLLDLRDQSTTLAGLEAYVPQEVNLAETDPPERAAILRVGPAFLGVLGVTPALGRDFTDEDNVRGAPAVAMLSHALWAERFGADPEVVGRTMTLDGAPHTVVGVLPAGFEFHSDPRILVPLQYAGAEHARGRRGFNAVSRLADGVTLDAARAEMDALFARLVSEYPESNEGWTTDIRPIRSFMVPESARASLTVLSWAVLLVLLIACVNVANLLLVRSESRQRELAVRVAMGAGRGRLLPVFLSESLLLGAAGGILGLAMAYLGVPVLVAIFGRTLPRADAIGVDGTVLGFAVAVSLLTGLVVGVLPALRVDVHRLAGQLKEGTRAVSRSGQRLRQALVVVEVALSVLLVAGAGLLVKSFANLAAIDTGLEAPEEVLVTTVVLSASQYQSRDSWAAFFGELVDAVEDLPGVTAAGMTSRLPLNGGFNVTNLYRFDDPERISNFVELRYVSPGFFDAVGVDLVAGRMLESADAEGGVNVVVTEELARQLFDGAAGAVGQAVLFEGAEEPERIVGVVSDLRDVGRTRAAPPGMYYVYGAAAAHGRGAILTVRTEGDPMAVLPHIRDVVRRLDPTIPVYGTRLLSDVEADTLGVQRFNVSLFGLFAVLALVLGAVGIYGVMSYMVAERTREMGVRMALGARSGEVVGMVLRGGLRLTGLGMAVGLAAALLSGRLVSDLLYEVDPRDPAVHAAVMAVLLVVAVVACWLPARRASSVDPVQALRHE